MSRSAKAVAGKGDKRKRHTWAALAAAAVLVTVTVLAYVPAMRAGYIWDDEVMLTDNPLVKEPGGLRRIWFSTEHVDYFPLTLTSLWLEWRLWNTDPTGYHVTNVMLHAVSVVLLWLALKRLKAPGAWLGAMIFAVHPVNVASVAWISERKNTLSLLFYLTTILFYLKHEDPATVRRWRWYALSLIAFLPALFSKTSVVMLPFVLVGCVWWLKGRVGLKDVLKTAPFFAMSLIMGLVTVWFQVHNSIGLEKIRFPDMPERIAGAGWAVWFYLYKAAVPLHESMVYALQQVHTRSIISFAPVALLAALFVALWLKRSSWGRPLLFGLGCFVATLAPVLGFFKMYFLNYSLVADHWQYIPLMSVIALTVGVVSHFRATWGPRRRAFAVFLALVIVGALCMLTWDRCGAFRDKKTLWVRTVSENPDSWIVHNCLGVAFSANEQYKIARSHLQIALGLADDVPRIHNNMGEALFRTGSWDEAISQYRRALELNPGYADAHNNLGIILIRKGGYDEGIAECREALRLSPHHSSAYFNIGEGLLSKGDYSGAIASYKEGFRWNPSNIAVRLKCGSLMAYMGMFDDAIVQYKEVARSKPQLIEPHFQLGMLYSEQNRLAEAADEYRIATRLAPGSYWAWQDLGMTLQKLGKVSEAQAALQEAERRKPRDQ